jgi:predicted ArsR family transcriptional regulator
VSAADVDRVLAAITERGSMTTSEVVTVLGLSRAQARAALRVLVERGSVVPAGERRGAVYGVDAAAAEAGRVARFARVARAAEREARGGGE